MSLAKPVLPIDAQIPELVEQIKNHASLIVCASPGAGKTTRLPPALCTLSEKKVWVLEPRRIAAISAASRISEENNWELGREVGYQVRFENKSSRETKLLFLTEALLLRKLVQDPELSEVGCVVLDEFHERSLHVDLALAALKELQELSRPDLKIVVMSATLNANPLKNFLPDSVVCDVPGKIFPLTVRLDEKVQLLRTGPDFTERMRKLTLKALSENPEGDLLCFLPGQSEIERLREALSSSLNENDYKILALHGRLSLQEQRKVLDPLCHGRKIVLATNVAESSLTVPGVRTVVDSGLARLSQIHPRTGFESLDLVRISKASAIQRAGRAARLGPGTAYRAWTSHDELSMKDFELPEIFRSDLSEALLLLSALGIRNFAQFSWFEMPSGKALITARDFLKNLGALGKENELTPLGKEIREFPLHPRLGKLLLNGKKQGLANEASLLAALLSEKDSSRDSSGSEHENDLLHRWEDLQRNSNQPRNRSLQRTWEQLRQFVRGSESSSPKNFEVDKWIPQILLDIYLDRLCRRRKTREPQAKMVGGRGVKLHPSSSVKNSEFFVALELSEGRDNAETLVFRAVGIPTSVIEQKLGPLSELVSRVEWDEEKKKFYVTEVKEWNGLSIGNENRRPAKPEEVGEQLVDIVVNDWERFLQNLPDLKQWFLRLDFLRKAHNEIPALSEEEIRKAVEMACYGENSIEKLQEKNLISFFEPLLARENLQLLNQECPTHWVVPTGNRIAIKYSEEQGAQAEVRLQELFGLQSVPKIAGQNLTLSLLAPNYRPVQVTRDLASFWKNTYPEVRKELRLRYPKHSWPDDPLTAPPQAKGRPRA